jgi:hypothetical protein
VQRYPGPPMYRLQHLRDRPAWFSDSAATRSRRRVPRVGWSGVAGPLGRAGAAVRRIPENAGHVHHGHRVAARRRDWMGCRPGRSRAAGRCCRGTGMAPTARSHQRSRQDAPQRFGEKQLHVRFRASRRRHRTSPPGYWDSLSCGSWPFSRCGSEAAGCSGSECRSNPITERHSVHIATAAAAPARPPTPPGGSNGIPCARFVRMGMPRRVNRAEETS